MVRKERSDSYPGAAVGRIGTKEVSMPKGINIIVATSSREHGCRLDHADRTASLTLRQRPTRRACPPADGGSAMQSAPFKNPSSQPPDIALDQGDTRPPGAPTARLMSSTVTSELSGSTPMMTCSMTLLLFLERMGDGQVGGQCYFELGSPPSEPRLATVFGGAQSRCEPHQQVVGSR